MEIKLTCMPQLFPKKIIITNTGREAAHEITVESAAMSGLEDINSFQFFTRLNMKNLHRYSSKLNKEHFRKVNEYSKFGSNFYKKCCYQRTFKQINGCFLINFYAFPFFLSFLTGYYLVHIYKLSVQP